MSSRTGSLCKCKSVQVTFSEYVLWWIFWWRQGKASIASNGCRLCFLLLARSTVQRAKCLYILTPLKKYICVNIYINIYIYIVVNIYIYTYTPQYLSFLFLSLDLQICTTEETDAPDLSPMSSHTGSETLSLSVFINFSIYIYELLAYAWKTSVRMDNHWWQYQYQRKQKDQ